VKTLRHEAQALKEMLAEQALELRLLKGHDLITSPAFIVIKASDEFNAKTTAPNQLWQTDFTYLKIIGWGRMYLSTILDDYSRYVTAWKLCTTMQVQDVTDTLNRVLEASGGASAKVAHKPRLLSGNGPCYITGDLAKWLGRRNIEHIRQAANCLKLSDDGHTQNMAPYQTN
jgi:transposase InsO family protein